MNLKNKQAERVALVTGAARRIGAEIVKSLHQAGYRVAIHCHRSLNEANALAQDLNTLRPDSAYVVPCDLRETAKLNELIEAVIKWAGSVHVLVNNASLFSPSKIEDSASVCDYQALYAVNVFAPWQLSILARPWLALDHGAIINLTDIHAKKPLKGYAEYCQTKAALAMQTKALAREFAPEIRVNAIAPGAILWPEAHNTLPLAVKDKIIHETPLNQHGKPEFIALAVLALLNNPFITGVTLRVDGGRFIV